MIMYNAYNGYAAVEPMAIDTDRHGIEQSRYHPNIRCSTTALRPDRKETMPEQGRTKLIELIIFEIVTGLIISNKEEEF